MTLTSHDTVALTTKTSQLYCCDLAGSEKMDKTITRDMTPAQVDARESFRDQAHSCASDCLEHFHQMNGAKTPCRPAVLMPSNPVRFKAKKIEDEGKKINTSLLALGNVISALAAGRKGGALATHRRRHSCCAGRHPDPQPLGKQACYAPHESMPPEC